MALRYGEKHIGSQKCKLLALNRHCPLKGFLNKRKRWKPHLRGPENHGLPGWRWSVLVSCNWPTPMIVKTLLNRRKPCWMTTFRKTEGEIGERSELQQRGRQNQPASLTLWHRCFRMPPPVPLALIRTRSGTNDKGEDNTLCRPLTGPTGHG